MRNAQVIFLCQRLSLLALVIPKIGKLTLFTAR